MELENSEFRRMVSILAAFPSFQDIQGRIALVNSVLSGVPRGNKLLARLNLNGPTGDVANSTIVTLMRFGRVTEDREALGLLISYILEETGGFDDDGMFMEDLIEKYNMTRPVVLSTPISDWKGQETPASVAEKVIGENTLRDVRMLALAMRATNAVIRVDLPNGYGSGFVVGDGLLFTNNHVLSDQEMANSSAFSFWYELGLDGLALPMKQVRAKQGGLFHTNPALDYTVVELDRVPDGVVPLEIRPKPLPPQSRVSIIQHPGGHYKKISMQNNFVEFANAEVIQYTTTTMPGSSGSPVFDDEFSVIAIHHSGGRLLEPGTNKRYLRNAGTSMIAVLKDLRKAAPAIFARVRPR